MKERMKVFIITAVMLFVTGCGSGKVAEEYRKMCIRDRAKSTEELDWKKPFRLKAAFHKDSRLNIGGYRIWVEEDCIRTDRSQVFAGLEGYHTQAKTPALNGRYILDIFATPNLIEIFINGGEYVISHVVYGLENRISGHVDQILTGSKSLGGEDGQKSRYFSE